MIESVCPPEVSMFTAGVIPEPVVSRRPNGLTLHTLLQGTQPILKLTLVWPLGPTADMPHGAASLAVNLLREGTRSYSGTQIADIIDFNGAVLEVKADEHHIVMHLVALTDKAPEVLPVLASMIAEPTFPEHEFEVLRQRSLSIALLTEERVKEIAGRRLRYMLFGPSAANYITTSADFERLTREDVVACHAACFGPDCCHALVSGPVPDALMAQITDMLDAMPRLGVQPVRLYPLEAEAPGRCDISVTDAVQAAVAIGLPAIPRSHPDYIPLHMVVRAFGGYFGSRLMANIREEKGYTYGISAGLLGSLDGGVINISAECDAAYSDAVIAEVVHEMERMVSEPPRGEELHNLQLNVMSSLMGHLDSPFSIMGYYTTALLVGLSPDYFERQQKVILEMTPEDYASIARKYLDPAQMRVVVAK